MQVFHQDLDRAIKNGTNRCQYSSKITPEQVVLMLVGATEPGAQPAARRLLHDMASRRWATLVGPHLSPSDPKTLHITIEVGRAYHLRLTARGFIFDITTNIGGQTTRAAGAPWTPPGAPR